MIEIRPLTFMDLAYVAINMREWDRREIFATAITDNPVDFAKIIANWGGPGWVAYKDREPVVAFGAAPLWKGVCSVWAFGTDRFPEVGLSVTRFIRKSMTPTLIEMGVHRVECKSMEGHTEAHAWLESLGLSREAEHPLYGRDGETFYTYARVHRAEQTDEVKEAA